MPAGQGVLKRMETREWTEDGEVEGEMEWSSVLSVYRLEGARGEGWNVTSADDDLQCRASSLSRKC